MQSLIENTYDIVLPSGRKGRVNVFDMNQAMACGGETYIELEDKSFIQAKYLKVIQWKGGK